MQCAKKVNLKSKPCTSNSIKQKPHQWAELNNFWISNK
uniref:Uncharacterized protein n=1 Tax=Rhizophora mucronata TaxID=61149 RepID=A0A2P2PXX2_RHIMU